MTKYKDMNITDEDKLKFANIFREILKVSKIMTELKFSREVRLTFQHNDEVRLNVRNPDVYKYKCLTEITLEQLDLMADIILLTILRYCKSITLSDIEISLNQFLIGLV